MAAQAENASPSSFDLEKNKVETEEKEAHRVQEKISEEKSDKFDQSSHIVVQNPNESVLNPNEGDQNLNAVGESPTPKPNENEAGEEEEGECGFCLFMKSGGCRDEFIAWEKCVEEGEANKEDIVAKCYKVTSLLKECMDRNSDYYEPVLRAERAMEEQVAEEMKEQGEGSHATRINRENESERTATVEVPNSEEKKD